MYEQSNYKSVFSHNILTNAHNCEITQLINRLLVKGQYTHAAFWEGWSPTLIWEGNISMGANIECDSLDCFS